MNLRPRFSLATLFLAVTAICVWLAWNVRLIHERKAVIEMILSRHGVANGEGDELLGVVYRGMLAEHLDRIPTLWKLFGVKPIGDVFLPNDEFTPEERRHIRDAFPELETFDGLLGRQAPDRIYSRYY
jgi:hypothetical protein